MSVKETVVLDIQTDSSKAEGSVKSLKAQLKEAQIEVQKMADKFGETSAQAVEAAKKAAELKDRIGDAKALTEAFSPDKKFQAFGAALTGVAGGFAAVQGAMGLLGANTKDVEKAMLKVQSAMALVQGLNAITEAGDAFKNLGAKAIDAFKGIKGAILATGLGALLIALGAVVAYWDDIKAAVTGISVEQEKLSIKNQKDLDIAKEKLKKVDEQAEILKLQGLTEDEILQRKRQQIAETIRLTKTQQILDENTYKSQLENSKRNKEWLQGALSFITKPTEWIMTMTIKTVNTLIGLANKIPGVNLKEANVEKLLKIADQAKKQVDDTIVDYLAGDKEITDAYEKKKKETQDALDSLAADDARIQNQINDKREKSNDQRIEIERKGNEELKKMQQENTLARISDDRKRQEAKLEFDLENSKKDIENSKLSAELKKKTITELENKYMLDLRALQTKFAEEDKKKKEEQDKKDAEDRKKKLEDQLKAEEETNDLINNARLAQIKDAGVKRLQEEANQYQKQIDKLYEQFNNGLITQQQFDAQREALKTIHEEKLTEIEKQNSEERIKTTEAEYQAKVGIYNSMGSALGALSEAIGKSTGIGKSMAMAELAINTGVAISGIVRQATKNPTNLTPFQLVADIAIRTAAVISNIKKAKELLNSAKVPGNAGGGPNPSIPTTAPIAPQMSSTALNQQMINQMGNAATRAFVVESDVSGNQERIRRLNRAARIN